MSLTSWAIVLGRYRDPANSRAAFVYLVMASFGTLCLLLGFGLLAGPAGGYAFETMRLASHTFFTATLAVVLALLGAGSKAGLVPLHVWLPLESMARARGLVTWRDHRCHWRFVCPDAARSEAAVGLSHGGEHRHHLY